MKFLVILGLGILSIFFQQTKSQNVKNGRVDLPPELINRAAVGSKYHGRNERGDGPSSGTPARSEDTASTDANIEPSVMQFSFLPPPPRRAEPPRYTSAGQSQSWQKPYQSNSDYQNANWQLQPVPVRYDVRAPSSRLHPPPEPSPSVHTLQSEDSMSLFENRPSPIPFNPYIRDYRPHITKAEDYPTSGSRGHVVTENEPIAIEERGHVDYPALYEGNPSSSDYYIPASNPNENVETDIEEFPLGTEERQVGKVNENSPPTDDAPTEFYEISSKKSVQPLNLAALLAGARTIGSGNPIIETNLNENQSQNRHTLKQQSAVSENPDTEYYDTLYDEFAYTYLDPDDGTTEAKVRPKTDDVREDHPYDTEVATIEKPINARALLPKIEITSAKTTLSSTSASSTSTTSTSSKSTTASTTSTKSKLTTVSGDSVQRARISNTPPISLSEVLQEMGISLPEFLKTLQEYGFSLKDFTLKIYEKSLSKLDFRRTKGDVKKMFAMIDAIPNRSNDKVTQGSNTTSTSTISETTSPTVKPTSPATITEEITIEFPVEVSTIPEILTKAPTRPPLIFGSNKGGIELANKGFKETKTLNNSNISIKDSKLPVTIGLDITSMMKNNGVSVADILQNFNSMFNFTEITESKNENNESVTASTIVTTIKPRLTTLPIRPYYPEPTKPKSYRPLGYEHGWWNKEREVINSRLSSTVRPTLRPPYVPPPPKISDGEQSSSEVEFGAAVIVDKSKPVNKEEDSRKDSTTKRNSYQNHNANNIYSKIRSGDPDAMGVATRSAIMAAGILGGVALSVFIAIFIVVKYKSHMHRNRRRTVLTLPSDSSTSSLPPIYTTRSCIALSKEAYRTSGFWNTLKKRFDPYSLSTSPTSIRDSYIYSER